MCLSSRRNHTLTQVLDAQLALLVPHAVEADVGAPAVAVHNGKAVPLGLPGKGQHLFSLVGQLKHLRGAFRGSLRCVIECVIEVCL